MAPDLVGVTAHRLGATLKTTAHALHYGLDLPVRKVPDAFRLLAGVLVTQSAITQDALRQILDLAAEELAGVRQRKCLRPVFRSFEKDRRRQRKPVHPRS